MSTEAAANTTTATTQTTTQTTPATTAGTTSATTDWTTGFTDDLRGYVQTKGFKDSATVVESYRNLEKAIGVPKEKLIKLPEKEDDPSWEDIHYRLGKPKESKEYQFETPKELWSEKDAAWVRETMHKLNLPRKQAEGLIKSWNEYMGGNMKAMTEAQQLEFKQQDEGLRKEWGKAYDQNVSIGSRAAKELNIDADTIDALEKSMGFGKVMKLFHTLGSKVGEHTYVSPDSGRQGFNGVMTPQQARDRINLLRGDSDFIRRYASGEAGPKEEMDRLHKFAYPSE